MGDTGIHFGSYVRWSRLKKGWSRRILAQKMQPYDGGISERQLARIEEGAVPTSYEKTVAAIALALEVDPMEFDRRWRVTPVPLKEKAAQASPPTMTIHTDPLTIELARLARGGDAVDITAVLAPLSRHQMEQLANVFVRRLRAMDRQNTPAAEKPKRKGGQQ